LKNGSAVLRAATAMADVERDPWADAAQFVGMMLNYM
jgi:hypothetical protein